VAPSSSSTKKAARLAQKGKGRRVRFQGGTLFPLVVAIVLVVGLGLVVYARASQPEDVAPFATDHWHGAYSFQLCSDEPNVQLTGNLEQLDANGNLVGSEAYITSGVHSHDDGVIHWHPTGSRATGRNAKLGVFFDNYDVELTDTRLVLPEGGFTVNGNPPPEDFPTEYEEGETKCDGQDARLTVVVWEDHRDPSSSQVYTSSFDDIPFDKNGLAITIAFVPDDVDVEMPPSAANLEQLGGLDQAPVPGETLPASPSASSEPTASSEVTAGSEPTASSAAATATTDSSGDTEASADSEPATTTATAGSETTG
jgi:hypothetical protein